MRRREFITGPLAVRAQRAALPVVALVNLRSAEAAVGLAVAFRKGLDEAGYIEGHNVTVEYNWLDGNSPHSRRATGFQQPFHSRRGRSWRVDELWGE